MSFNKFIFSLLLMITSLTTNAQFKLSGFAFDGSGNILTQTELTLSNSSNSWTTKSNNIGEYVFTNLENGSYELTLQIKDHIEKLNFEISNQNKELDIYLLNYNPEDQLDDLVIKVETIKSQLEKEGFAMNVIETKEAALRNIQTNELLDRSVGIRVRQNGGLGAAVNYNLNGVAGNGVRIFIDGIPMSSYGPSFSLNSIPPALIERIEVYKGVVPVHLSDDALGGVINIILKRGINNLINASVSYGSFNTFQSNFSGTFRNQKTGFTVKASGFHNYSDNDYEVWGKFVYNRNSEGNKVFTRGKRFNDAYRSSGGRIEAGFTDVKWADRFLIGFNGSDDYNEIQHGQYMTVPYKGRFTKSKANIFTLNYHKKNIFIDGLDLDINATTGKRSEVINDTVKWRYDWSGNIVLGKYGEKIATTSGAQQGKPTLQDIERNTSNIRTGLIYRLNQNHKISINHSFTYLKRYESDLFKSSAQKEYQQERDFEKSIIALGYELRAFENRLKANLFVKNYNQNLKSIKPEPVQNEEGNIVKEVNTQKSNYNLNGYGFAASYLITPSVSILVSAEKAVRLPSDDEVFGSPGANVIENLFLRPEQSDNYNIGFKVGPYEINKKHKFSLGGSGFIRNTKDQIVSEINTRFNEATGALPMQNLGKTKAIGFEAELNYVYQDNLTILINASKFNSLYNTKYDPNGNFVEHRFREQLPNTPFFTMNLSAQYTLRNIFQKKSNLNLYYNIGFVDSFYTIWSLAPNISNRESELKNAQTPIQFIQDLGTSYVFPNRQFVLSLDVNNIFNEQAYDNFAVQKPGRAFYFKINYTFNKF